MELKEYIKNNLNEILSDQTLYPVERTTRDVWGKEIIRLKHTEQNNYEKEIYELENWYIDIPYKDWYNLKTFVDIIKESVRMKEKRICYNKDFKHCELLQYCLVKEWQYLGDYDDKIILVKYGKVLPKTLGE